MKESRVRPIGGRAARRLDAQERIKSRAEAPRPELLGVFLVARLVGVPEGFARQSGEQFPTRFVARSAQKSKLIFSICSAI